MRKGLLILGLSLVASPAFAIIQIDLVASAAPNAFGSASFQPWFNNAQFALRNNLSVSGSGFSQFVNVSGSTRPYTEAAVTGFNSWQGVAGNSTSELGQRMHFVYRIYNTDGSDVLLSNVRNISITGRFLDGFDDAFGPFNFSGSTVFDPSRRVGYLSNGTQVTSGNGPVKQIIGTFGSAYEPDPSWTGTNQQKLDQLLAELANPVSGLYTMEATVGYQTSLTSVFTRSQFVNFQPVPEPGTMAALGLGVAALIRRRRNAKR
jgi:hypothetical protein